MPQLSPHQLYALARGAGLSASNGVIATAVALAESSGITDNRGPVGERGLWQINPPSHPDWAQQNLDDPKVNAAAMAAISSGGTDWHQWCTAYTDGACGTKGGVYAPTSPNSPSGAQLQRAAKGAGGDWRSTLRDIVTFPARIPSDIGGLLGKGAKAAGGAAGSAASAAAQGVVKGLWDSVLAKVMFVGLALGLAGLGAYQLFRPQIRQAQDRAAELGGIAAKAGV